jgi:hypothetical protein
LIKKAVIEIVFDVITVAVFGAAIVALIYISRNLQPHKHTNKCLIEENKK